MVVYAFYVFDRHGMLDLTLLHDLQRDLQRAAECIYKKKWTPRPTSSSQSQPPNGVSASKALSAEDDAKLIFGTIFSLRNMVRKLGGPDDKYGDLSQFKTIQIAADCH